MAGVVELDSIKSLPDRTITGNYGATPASKSEQETTNPENVAPLVYEFSARYASLASTIASISGILFGYDTGIIAGALLQLKKDFQLSSFQQEMLVTSMLIGSFFACFFGGTIVDRFGRKTAIVFSSILFVVGAMLLCASTTLWMLIVGRTVVGVAIAVSITSECTYISEISPPDRRGMMVSLNEVGITVGFLIAYLLNYAFISVKDGWRYMFGISALPAFIQVIGIFFMPQSPHYLIIKGETQKAEELLKMLRKQSEAEEELKAIVSALEEEKSRNYLSLLSSENNMRGRMFLGMALVFLQQFSGQPSVLYYSPTVFQRFGYCSDSVATLVTVGLGVVKVISTLFTLLTVDRFGRRCLLLTGCFFLAASIIVLGVVASFEAAAMSANPCTGIKTFDNENISSIDYNHTDYEIFPDNNSGENNTLADLQEIINNTIKENANTVEINASFTAKLVSIISLMVFVCAYGISYGPVTWLVLSEIFPTSLRGRAISVATCVNWGSNIIISLTFLQMLDDFGTGQTFLFYGGISTIAFLFVFFCLPETKNKSLEQINQDLSKSIFVTPNFCCSKTCI